jgi:hypothetical protein
MNISELLTRNERKILAKVAKPCFPTVLFWCIIVLAVDGTAAIVFSLRDCLIASEMVKHEDPQAIMVVGESLIFLLLAGIALFSALWWTVIRSYGMLLRKLGSELVSDEKPPTN